MRGKIRKNNRNDGNFADLKLVHDEENFNSYRKEVATTVEGGGGMDDGTKMILEQMDKDSRERESRYHNDAKERESRYREEMKAQDERWKQESKEREDRLLSAINDMKSDLRSDFKDVKDEAKTTKFTVIGLTISVILGVAAMVIAVVLAK